MGSIGNEFQSVIRPLLSLHKALNMSIGSADFFALLLSFRTCSVQNLCTHILLKSTTSHRYSLIRPIISVLEPTANTALPVDAID